MNSQDHSLSGFYIDHESPPLERSRRKCGTPLTSGPAYLFDRTACRPGKLETEPGRGIAGIHDYDHGRIGTEQPVGDRRTFGGQDLESAAAEG